MAKTKKKQSRPRISQKEKSAPAYRKKLEIEVSQLKQSLESTQNEASTLQQKNFDLEKDNAVLKERIKGVGTENVIKDIFFFFAGVGASFFIEGNYFACSIAIGIAALVVGGYFILKAFKRNT